MFLLKCTRNISRFSWKKINQFYYKLLPPTCVLCGTFILKPFNLCPPCHASLPILTHKCHICAQPLSFVSDTVLCGRCLKQPPPFDLVHALCAYEPPITHLIVALKFQGKLSYAQTLGELLAEKIGQAWYPSQLLPDVIVPVPLHAKRLRERGFNQALEIARPVAKRLHLPITLHGITRIKHTMPQSHLTANKREQNIARAFAVTHDFKGLTVAVLDDVMTTGHTMIEFCKAIKRNGANNIHVWCCARR